VRRECLEAAGKLGRAARPLLPRVRAACKDREDTVRIEAAETLWRISGQKDEAIDMLRSVYRDGKGPARAWAIETMRTIEKRKEQLTMLVHLLKDEDHQTCTTAARILSELAAESREVLPAVEALTKHRSHEVRKTALQLRQAMTKDQDPR
jgi:HEAT repeat protein